MRFDRETYFKSLRLWFFLYSVQRLGVCRQRFDMVGCTIIKVEQ